MEKEIIIVDIKYLPEGGRIAITNDGDGGLEKAEYDRFGRIKNVYNHDFRNGWVLNRSYRYQKKDTIKIIYAVPIDGFWSWAISYRKYNSKGYLRLLTTEVGHYYTHYFIKYNTGDDNAIVFKREKKITWSGRKIGYHDIIKRSKSGCCISTSTTLSALYLETTLLADPHLENLGMFGVL